jgi:hypothetical protein
MCNQVLLSLTMKTIPSEILEDLETLRATIRGCDVALAANLETWERKEYRQVREEAMANLTAREAAIATLLA